MLWECMHNQCILKSARQLIFQSLSMFGQNMCWTFQYLLVYILQSFLGPKTCSEKDSLLQNIQFDWQHMSDKDLLDK